MNGWYSKPLEGHTTDFNNPADYANIHGDGTLDADASTMEAVYITASMLSIYYYAQAIDFASLADGKALSIPIAGQSGNDLLQIVYNGTGTATTDGGSLVYKISFRYKYNGGLDSYSVDCEISQSSRAPIYFSAEIAIGHVQMSLD